MIARKFLRSRLVVSCSSTAVAAGSFFSSNLFLFSALAAAGLEAGAGSRLGYELEVSPGCALPLALVVTWKAGWKAAAKLTPAWSVGPTGTRPASAASSRISCQLWIGWSPSSLRFVLIVNVVVVVVPEVVLLV